MGPADTRIRLLGGFALELLRTPIPVTVSMQRMLAFLAVRGPAHRSVLAGTLWPEVSEGHALASLRTSVWRTNKLLPGLVDPEGATLRLSEAVSVDIREQEAFIRRLLRPQHGDDGWLVCAADRLSAGDLLPGWYDDWVVFERERLTQLRLLALDHTARALLEHGMVDTALEVALEAVRTEPLRESATATLMAVHLAQGNVVGALRQYQLFRRLLLGELGVEPSARLSNMLPPVSPGPSHDV